MKKTQTDHYNIFEFYISDSWTSSSTYTVVQNKGKLSVSFTWRFLVQPYIRMDVQAPTNDATQLVSGFTESQYQKKMS